MAEQGKIFKAICDIMAEDAVIGKDQRNEQQKFNYRGVDVVMNVFHPLLAKHHIFVVPEVLDCIRDERTTKSGGNMFYTVIKMRYTFYADDGSHVEAVVQGEGMDTGDKSSNKAMSVAFKYAMFQVFCIPTEEMKDPDEETPEQSKPKAKAPAKAQKKPLRTADDCVEVFMHGELCGFTEDKMRETCIKKYKADFEYITAEQFAEISAIMKAKAEKEMQKMDDVEEIK